MTGALSSVGSVSASRSVRSGRFYCILLIPSAQQSYNQCGCGYLYASSRAQPFRHGRMGEYLVILASLTSFSASTQDSKGTVMSTMTAYVGPITTISGRKLPGESGMHCSTYRSPSESGIALTTLCRFLLCLSLIRGPFGVQAFKVCAMVSGADPHLRHVSFSILRALLATPFWRHSGLVGD